MKTIPKMEFLFVCFTFHVLPFASKSANVSNENDPSTITEHSSEIKVFTVSMKCHFNVQHLCVC